ncbi:hypothetical protein CFAM422_008938 [Trichoderma lentiforme]|uniref:Uncharacterized protein n=1 Tax=Trichoderma lentiforme TaxID=1567552 RepID=A0A9P4XBQ6_9HYPO|nr:hypothetical protein CFAM422_008938 [Trichoderma lentiforme]
MKLLYQIVAFAIAATTVASVPMTTDTIDQIAIGVASIIYVTPLKRDLNDTETLDAPDTATLETRQGAGVAYTPVVMFHTQTGHWTIAPFNSNAKATENFPRNFGKQWGLVQFSKSDTSNPFYRLTMHTPTTDGVDVIDRIITAGIRYARRSHSAQTWRHLSAATNVKPMSRPNTYGRNNGLTTHGSIRALWLEDDIGRQVRSHM